MSRYARRVDGNHREIILMLQRCGAKVWDVSRLGGGFPDLLVAIKDSPHGEWRLRLVEVKDGAKVPSKRRLTAPEARFADSVPDGLYAVVSSTAEVLDLFPRQFRGEAA